MTGHLWSSGQQLGSALPADGVQPCPFSSDSPFGCAPGLILGAYIGAHLLITPGLGALQVTLALLESSRSCPLPTMPSTYGHSGLPGL